MINYKRLNLCAALATYNPNQINYFTHPQQEIHKQSASKTRKSGVYTV